ncbi:hypothetical protein KGF54_005602 [Candida jiufengensis]|uniref:uncharacterized protein n=1 Tax=Candida jiufengensis TaxID=497108 RepID=UPI002225134D|nr:uncharacterized protein KGF54_005602 [Candida jiufengensis]KAI5949367.1 hypothetical protein KGF54_005602 [Candida jiufengensis]
MTDSTVHVANSETNKTCEELDIWEKNQPEDTYSFVYATVSSNGDLILEADSLYPDNSIVDHFEKNHLGKEVVMYYHQEVSQLNVPPFKSTEEARKYLIDRYKKYSDKDFEAKNIDIWKAYKDNLQNSKSKDEMNNAKKEYHLKINELMTSYQSKLEMEGKNA